MKYLFTLSLTLLCFSFQIKAQQLAEACTTAKKENKLIMIVVESEKCIQCNDVANQAFSSEVFKRAVLASCILLRVKKIPEALDGAYTTYSFSEDFFGAIYIDPEKNILNVFQGSASFYKSYLDNLEKAIKEKESPNPKLNELVTNYYGKTGTFEAAYHLIEKIRSIGLEPKGDLLDDFVQKAPTDSAISLSFLQFIERAAPTIGSAAQIYVEKNRDNYNMAWYRMSQQERVSINKRIYYKSLQKAIANKDQQYMFRVANARQSNFQSSPPERLQQMYQETFLQYYKGVHDSSSYLMSATRYYDTYLMTVNVDSILRVDSIKKAGMFKLPPSGPNLSTSVPNTQMIGFAPQAQFYANALNDGAWTI